MEFPWDKGPDRAERLLAQYPQASELLSFYQSLLVFQRSLFDSFGGTDFSASLSHDLPVLMNSFDVFLDWTAEKGPIFLISQAQEISQWGKRKQEDLLLSYWRGEEIPAGNFFPKAFLQPYAAFLVSHQRAIQDRTIGERACPYCGGAPQTSYLQTPPSVAGSGSEGAGRYLLCSLCFTDWPINRICCAHCREVDPYKLPYYQTDEMPAVRVEGCDTCKYYIKGVDLTKDGLAVPLVDEIATPALDLWAQENGYTKVELNLAGI